MTRSPFPTFTRWGRWLISWRILGRILAGMGAGLTLIGAFYTVANWRGGRAWNHYRRELEARGVPVDFEAIWPKPVPDDQNFAAAPPVRTWYEKPYGTDTDERWKDAYDLASKRALDARDSPAFPRQFMDLVGWDLAFTAIQTGELTRQSPRQEASVTNKLDRVSRAKAAPGVLAGLSANAAVFAELQTANRRPFFRYPRTHESPREILMPGDFWRACTRLKLKVCAELAAGQDAQAFEEVKLMLCLADSQQAVPTLFSQWDRIFLFQLAAHAIWEGLAERVWTPPQLLELTARLPRYDFLTDCKNGFDAERAAGLWEIDAAQHTGQPASMMDSLDGQPIGVHMFGDGLVKFIGWAMPHGWYAREELAYCQLFQMYLRSGFEPSQRRVSPAIIQANAAAADQAYRENYPPGKYPGVCLRAVLGHRLAAATLIQTNNFEIINRFCFTQVTADQAAVGCALEQYRLAHGKFPDTLAALAPQFISTLPKDIFSGEPFKYRRLAESQFILYSVGWNEKDDGGMINLTKNSLAAYREGDWVWEYPVSP